MELLAFVIAGAIPAFIAGYLLGSRHRRRHRVHRLIILGEIMASVSEGGTLNFVVIATNKAGRVVPDTGITVSLDNAALGTATVATDGTGGVFTADGQEVSGNMTATDGTVTSDPFPLSVTLDNTVAKLAINPV